MKCYSCNSKNTVKYIDDLFWYARCRDCGKHWPIKSPRRPPSTLILVGLFLLAAALIILAFLPVTLTFYGSSCGWTGGDTTTCEPVAYYTTRPVWLWLAGGGW